jgi:hypothetical protein
MILMVVTGMMILVFVASSDEIMFMALMVVMVQFGDNTD